MMMGNTVPKISVAMPVYNAELYIREAVDSILNQTFTDFEFIIIDDCSTDSSYEILKTYKDSRIRFFRNDTNLKISATLNKAIDLAQGDYLARMDADDISSPKRLEIQYNFLENHLDVDMCGTGIRVFGYYEYEHFRPEKYKELKDYSLHGTAFSHPTFMANKKVYKAMRYDETHVGAEDYLLFSELLQQYKGVNIPQILLDYRISGNQISYVKNKDGDVELSNHQLCLYFEIFRKNLQRMYPKNNMIDYTLMEDYFSGKKNLLSEDYLNFKSYYTFLKSSNKDVFYSNEVLKKIYVERFINSFESIYKASGKGVFLKTILSFFIDVKSNHKIAVGKELIFKLRDKVKFLVKNKYG